MNRNARRVKMQAMLMAATVASKRYAAKCRAILGGLHAAMQDALAPHLASLTGKTAARMDAGHSAWKKAIDDIEGRFAAVRTKTGEAFDEMAATVNKKNHAAAADLLGITPAATRTAGVIMKFRDQNIALMEKAARDYVDDVRDVLEEPDTFGLRVEDLSKRIQERADVSKSRADLIARDQTLKLNGQLNQTRQENAGVVEYIWSTSHDERVRPIHVELDGTRQRWSDPPVTDEDGNVNHPGQDFQCRCVALPVVADLDEPAEE